MTDAAGQSEIFAPDMLAGRAALVTGGGTGLGKATALELVRCGAKVTIAGRRLDVLEEAAAECAELVGPVAAVAGDIRDPKSAWQMVSSVLERHGRLDALVNNAGGQFFSAAESIATKGWDAVWRLNVEGMLTMSEAAFDGAFRGAGGGTIVNTTLSPHHGMPGMAHSGAARATVEALTLELAERWAGAGVVVSAVAPGVFETDVLAKYPAQVRAGMAGTVPLQRLGTPQEHAWLVVLLVSSLGRGFSGETITLDAARDNWWGAWPPTGLLDEGGEVPVEQRRPV
jgi:citronellol/citronellal dehydrogenase